MTVTARPVAEGDLRDRRLDALKVVAILGVVLGHAIRAPFGDPVDAPVEWGVVYSLLASFSVPAFLLVSGALSPGLPGGRWLLGRARRLLVPYAAWVLVQWLVYFRDEPPRYVLDLLLYPSATNALWFLPALFACCAVLVIMRGSVAGMVVASLGCVILAPMVPMLGLGLAAGVFPYFAVGWLLGRDAGAVRPMALAAPLLVFLLWQQPGMGLAWSRPWWNTQLVSALSPYVGPDLAEAPLRVLRVLLGLALVGSAQIAIASVAPIARLLAPSAPLAVGWRWLAANTLGVYCGHILFLRLSLGTGHAAVLTSFAASLVLGSALAYVIGLWPPADAALLGGGPSRARKRGARRIGNEDTDGKVAG